MENLGDGTIDTVNDLSARISRVLDDAVPVVENLERGTGKLDTALSRLEETVESLEEAGGPGSEALRAFSKAMEALEQANGQIRDAAADVSEALELLRESVGLSEETRAALVQLASALFKLGKALGTTAGAVGDLMDALAGLSSCRTENGMMRRFRRSLPPGAGKRWRPWGVWRGAVQNGITAFEGGAGRRKHAKSAKR